MRLRPAIAVFAVLMLTAPFARGATPAMGTGRATSTLVQVTAGSTVIAAGSDDAQAQNESSKRAFARFVSGQAADQSIGAAEKTVTNQGDTATVTVGDSAISIGDLVSLGTTGAIVTTTIGTDVSSNVQMQLGSVGLLGGLLQLDGGSSTTDARAGETGSRVSRTISLGNVHALALGKLLAALGVDPLNLACGAIENAGAIIGADTATTCAQLATATSAISDALATLQTARDDLIAIRDSTIAALANAQAALSTASAQIDAALASIEALNGSRSALLSQRDALIAARDALQAQLDAANAARASALTQQAALQSQLAGYSRAQVQSDRDATANLCTGLDPLNTALCQATALATTLPTLATTYGVSPLPITFGAAQQALLDALDALLTAFDALDSVNAQIAALDAQITDLTAQIASDNSQIDALNAQIAALDAQIAAAQADVDALQAQIDSLQATIAGLSAQLDQLLANIAAIDVPSATDTTCDIISSTLTSVAGLVPSLQSTLDPARANVDNACAALAGGLAAFLDIPLLTINGVDIHIDVNAEQDTPSVSVVGSVGSVQVGALPALALDLPAEGDSIPAVSALLSATITGVTTSLGLDIPLPEVALLTTTKSAGQATDGSWFAHGSTTILHVGLPAATLTIPAAPPLGVLSGTGGFSAPLSSRGPLAPLDAPTLSVDIGTFNADSSFAAATSGGPGAGGGTGGGGGGTGGGGGGPGGGGGGGGGQNGGHLPRTGVADPNAFLAACAFVSAALLKRALRRR